MTHTVLATFRVRGGSQAELSGLLERHWYIISQAGFAEGPQPIRLIRHDSDGDVMLELFDWRDGGLNDALQDNAVREVWMAIDSCCEPRGGAPQSEFPAIERVQRTGTA